MNGSKILIVEDARIIAMHLKSILERAGYVVIGTTTTKHETLSVLGRETPDLILMDIMLGDDVDGIDTIKKIQETHDIPFIYLTALTDRATIKRAKLTKPYGYIMKPFQPEQVLTLIEMALHKYATENRLKETEQKFRAAVSAISDCFIFLDEDFRINYINRATERIAGCTLQECLNHNFYDYFKFKDPDTGEPVTSLWNGSHESISAGITSLVLVNRQDKEIPVGDGTITKVVDNHRRLKGVVITFRDIAERLKKINLREELEKKQLTAMIEGQEMERLRIARELHDGLGQMLNAIKLKLNQLVNTKDYSDLPRSQLLQLPEFISEAINETSRISENLLPSKLKNFDLPTCIQSILTTDYPNLVTSFESAGIRSERLSMNKKVNLYRITQELVANCVKHAEASHLSIQFYGDTRKVTLTVEDDGKGFDFSRQPDDVLNGHNGLQNIIDRVKIMDGKLDVDSKKNIGSLTIIEVPYDG